MNLSAASAESPEPLRIGGLLSALSLIAGFGASAAPSGYALPLALGMAIALIAASWLVPEKQGVVTRWLFEIRAHIRG